MRIARASSSMGVVSRLRLEGSWNVIRRTVPSLVVVHSLTITESRAATTTHPEQAGPTWIKDSPVRAEGELWSPDQC